MPKFLNSSTPTNLHQLIDSIGVNIIGSTKYAKFKSLYKNDRIAFVYDVMPHLARTITPYQEEILGMLDDKKSRIAVRGPHGLGKTFLASIIVHHSILTSEEDCKVPTTASAWRQLEKYLWPEIRKSSKHIAWPVVGRSPYDGRTEFLSLSLKLQDEDIEAFALASDDHTTLEGAHAHRIVFVFDEAKTIPSGTWDAVEGAFSTESLSDTHEAIAFAISTPGDPAGRFYDIHMRRPGYEDWHVRHVTIDEAIRAGRISQSWYEARKRQWGEDSSVFQNRVLGEFADNSEEAIVPLSWVRLAHDRWREWDRQGRPTIGTRVTLGCDIARMGQDATVVAVGNLSTIQTMHIFRKLPLTSVSGNIVRIASQLSAQPVINIEMEGPGAAVYDMMRENEIKNVRPINVSNKTWKKTRDGTSGFVNIRAAMWWNLREMLDPINGDGLMLPPIDELTADLTTPRYDYTSQGNIQLESRKNIMMRLGRSPDYGTAVALAMWKATSGGGVVG